MRLFHRLLALNIKLDHVPKGRSSKGKEQKSLKIAIIGTPNVGKSALTNQLIKTDLCAVSKVIDTTRMNMLTTLTEGACQLIVVDSPGLIGIEHAKKVVNTHSESKILVDPENALSQAEHVIVVDDVTSPGEYIHHRVLHMLHRNPHIPSTLVINKCDMIKQRSNLLKRAQILTCGMIDGNPITVETSSLGKLNKFVKQTPKISISLSSMENRLENKDSKWIESYNKIINKPTHKCPWSETKQVFKTEPGWPHFSSLFFVSAKTGDGIDELRQHLQKISMPVDEWKFDRDVQTTKRPHFVVCEHIRSALLNCIPSDIAYKLKIKIMHWENNSDELRIIAHVLCDKQRLGRMVATALQGQTPEIEEKFRSLFKKDVVLDVIAKVDGKIVE